MPENRDEAIAAVLDELREAVAVAVERAMRELRRLGVDGQAYRVKAG